MSIRYIDVADKTTLDKIYNYLVDENPVFGFVEHMAIKNPAQRIEYIGANKDYTPMTMNMTTHEMNYGSWAGFDIIKANRPWMVRFDGTPDYELCPTDYTKKIDGTTASDVSNLDYAGGAYSWLKKIYSQEYVVGTDRVRKFCMSPIDGFEPVGFVDADGHELEGVWLPMFYGFHDTNGKVRSIAGTQPTVSVKTAQQQTAMEAAGNRHKFLGGSIVNVINDLLYMFAKSTDSQGCYGKGNCSGYVNNSAQYYGVKANAVVGGGQFYGSSDGTSLNKVFHSIVLGSFQIWCRDPYTILDGGKLYVSPKRKYSLTHTDYVDTGIKFTTNGGWHYPHRARTIPGFGMVMVEPYDGGSSALGYTDGFYLNVSGVRVGLRFGGCAYGATDGFAALYLDYEAGGAGWGIGDADLLEPPVGVAV